jgi:hypothetical protein
MRRTRIKVAQKQYEIKQSDAKKVLNSERIGGFFRGVEITFSIVDCRKYVGGIEVSFKKIDDGHTDRNFPKKANLFDGRLGNLKGLTSQKEIDKNEILKYFNYKKRSEDPGKKKNKRKKIKKIRQSAIRA